MDFVNILGTKVNRVTMEEAVNVAMSFLETDEANVIYTPNSQIILYASENKDYEERNVPKQMVCPAVAPQTGRCYGLAKYNGYFLRERSYSVSQTVSWSAKTKDTAAVKYTRFRSPSKVCHIVDGIGMPSYVQYVESYFKPEYPINENRTVDYRHGGQLNVLALAGNVATVSQLKVVGVKGKFDEQEGM